VNAYVLKTSPEAQKALDIQQSILEHQSLDTLNRAGLKAGDSVWDIGCGSGAMTTVLAKIVGSSGKVFALDSSLEQIEATKKRVAESGLKNVEYVHAKLEGLLEDCELAKPNSTDFIYARYVFMHLKDPKAILEEITKILKPGWRLIVQEPVWSPNEEFSQLLLLAEYMSVVKKCMDFYQIDYKIGEKMPAFAKALSLKEVYYAPEKSIYSSEKLESLMAIRIEELKDKMLESNVATPKDIDRWRLIPMKIKEAGAGFSCCMDSMHIAIFEK